MFHVKHQQKDFKYALKAYFCSKKAAQKRKNTQTFGIINKTRSFFDSELYMPTKKTYL